MIYILDACAMIAFLRKEFGSDVVEAILLDKNNECFAHAINLCEVFYDFHRLSGEQAAEKAIGDLKAAGIIERNDFDQIFWKEVGRIKSQNRASLADCVAIVLANQLGGTVLTSDHHEFDKIAQDRVCSIQFIR
ncbi:MAG: type II toxin-antitoxin system VapC family toxin [Acidobacteria bacterium]|jgi:PIN domain nuclease of toxin-antitoxin system|nr:type II toxin-antitoxin system VapC family toxin [Acidobacteriota bacterium]HEV8160319.1 type II toxin-antitoxin system VapC family toxin [Pyrinomonadaceae bacterium]